MSGPARRLRMSVAPDSPICPSGKRGHRTEEDVRAMLGRARAVRRDEPDGGRRPGRVEQGWYRCPACAWWHLHSASRRRTRRGDHGD